MIVRQAGRCNRQAGLSAEPCGVAGASALRRGSTGRRPDSNARIALCQRRKSMRGRGHSNSSKKAVSGVVLRVYRQPAETGEGRGSFGQRRREVLPGAWVIIVKEVKKINQPGVEGSPLAGSGEGFLHRDSHTNEGTLWQVLLIPERVSLTIPRNRPDLPGAEWHDIGKELGGQ